MSRSSSRKHLGLPLTTWGATVANKYHSPQTYRNRWSFFAHKNHSVLQCVRRGRLAAKEKLHDGGGVRRNHRWGEGLDPPGEDGGVGVEEGLESGAEVPEVQETPEGPVL